MLFFENGVGGGRGELTAFFSYNFEENTSLQILGYTPVYSFVVGPL